LKQGIDALTRKSSFVEGWSLLGARFPNLLDYCGNVATLFTITSAVEFDFFVLCWDKDEFCKVLSDFSLERIQSSICLLNNFLSPINKICPHCLSPKLTFPDEP
jgi:hypothetical protein